MAAGDIFQVDLLWSVNGEKCANVLHFEESVAPADNPEVSLANAVVSDLFTTLMQDCISEQATLQTIRVRRVQPTAGGPIITVVEQAGAISGESMPPNSTIRVTWYTPRFDKHGRGRTNFVGVPITFHERGVLVELAVDNFNTLATAMIGNISNNGGTWHMCIYNRTAEEVEDCNRYFVRKQLHTLRGRKKANP